MKAVVSYYTTSDESGTEAYAANNVVSPAQMVTVTVRTKVAKNATQAIA
jgi:hypothetical protein